MSEKDDKKEVILVPHGHIISRFVLSKSNYSVQNQELKYNSFMPPNDYPDEISVYDIKGLDDVTIWKIGDEFVANLRRKPILARGDMSVGNVVEITNKESNKKLYVERETTPHELHANIRNIETEQGKRKIIAKKIAKTTKNKLKLASGSNDN